MNPEQDLDDWALAFGAGAGSDVPHASEGGMPAPTWLVKARAERLLDPQNDAMLRRLIASLPPGLPSRRYRGHFLRDPERGERLLNTPLDDLTDARILADLPWLREEAPDFLDTLVFGWMRDRDAALRALAGGQTWPDDTPADALAVAMWLVSSERGEAPSTSSEAWTGQLLERLKVAEAALQSESDQVALAAQKVATLERDFDAVHGDVLELRGALETQGQTLAEQARQLGDLQGKCVKLTRQNVALWAERIVNGERDDRRLASFLQTVVRQNEGAHDPWPEKVPPACYLARRLALQSPSDYPMTCQVLDSSGRTVGDVIGDIAAPPDSDLAATQREMSHLRMMHEYELSALRGQVARLSEQIKGHDRELEARDVEIQLAEASVSTLRAERDALGATLMEAHAELESYRGRDPKFAVAIGRQELDRALVINYQAIAGTPLERLAGLFEAYAALLDGRFSEPTLAGASNISRFTPSNPPGGILVIGFERLLEDGANSALSRFLRLPVMRQESAVRRAAALNLSPRLVNE